MVDIIVREADPEAIILFGSAPAAMRAPILISTLLVIEREPFGPAAAGSRRRRGCIGLWVICQPPKTCWSTVATR